MMKLSLLLVGFLTALPCVADEPVTIECRTAATGTVCTINHAKDFTPEQCRGMIQKLATLPNRPQLRFLVEPDFPSGQFLSLLHTAGKNGFREVEVGPRDGQEHEFNPEFNPGLRVITPRIVDWEKPELGTSKDDAANQAPEGTARKLAAPQR